MEDKFTLEMLAKAKAAKSAEELKVLAKEYGWEMTAEEAEAYFKQLHTFEGEMQDEELENAAGGVSACYNDGRMVVTAVAQCSHWICKNCGSGTGYERAPFGGWLPVDGNKYCRTSVTCGNCKCCSYERGLWLCNSEQANAEGSISLLS